jgi:hypothetical protein
MSKQETESDFWAVSPDGAYLRGSVLWARFLRILKLAGLAH